LRLQGGRPTRTCHTLVREALKFLQNVKNEVVAVVAITLSGAKTLRAQPQLDWIASRSDELRTDWNIKTSLHEHFDYDH
jgi:hypothetical protein